MNGEEDVSMDSLNGENIHDENYTNKKQTKIIDAQRLGEAKRKLSGHSWNGKGIKRTKLVIVVMESLVHRGLMLNK